MRLVLVDPQSRLCEAWRAAFAEHADVTVVQGLFEELDGFDCLVSPANSFGIMDGGVDLAIRRFFPGIQESVQRGILEEFYGYQPVGTSLLVKTGNANHPWLAHTPTMRYPMPLSGGAIHQVHEATWAMLCAVKRHNARGDEPRIESVACPGLGTATGGVEPTTAAQLMAFAYESHLEPKIHPTWKTVDRRHV